MKEKKEKVKQYNRKAGMPFPLLLDSNGQVTKNYGVRGFPAHFLIDQKGDIKAYAPGAKSWESKKSHSLIKFLIDPKNI